MKAALICNLTSGDFQANQRRIFELAQQAIQMGARFLLFGEAAATGLCNIGKPEHDLKIAEEIPGCRNQQWREFAKKHEVYFSAGLLEKEDGRMYDSGLLFNPAGELILHYRRIHSGWRWPNDNPQIYCTGEDLAMVETEIGKIGMLICGDLWNDDIIKRFAEQEPDYLLYPFLRSLKKNASVKDVWPHELQRYTQRWSQTGAVTLAVNLYQGTKPECSFGGAWFVGKDGKIISELSVWQQGILLVDLPEISV